MSRVATFKWSFVSVCGFACVLNFAAMIDSASAQELPRKDDQKVREVTAKLQGRGIPAEEIAETKQLFHAFAKYYADVVASPAVYKASLEPKFGPQVVRTPTIDHNRDTGIFFDLDRFIPVPTLGSKVNADKLDYIREMGIAFDAVLKPLIETNPNRIVRINATRLLAEVCRSGASAHWPTVTKLLTDPKVPTEIKLYALQAAGNLLAAYDANDYSKRKHSNEPMEVALLVNALMHCLRDFSMLMPGVKATEATPDQLAVVSFVRRYAVKALAQVRFVTIPGPDRNPIYPAYALAQVCVSDPVLVPSPSPGECAEAVIGLCNMAPSANGTAVKSFNPEGAVEAIAVGIKTFATPRTDPTDHSLPWRNYTNRIAEALKNWRPLFDPVFEATLPNEFNAGLVPPAVADLTGRVQTMIIAPIEKVTIEGKPDPAARVDIEGLERYIEQLRENPNRKPLLFTNNPDTKIFVPGMK